MKGSVGPPRRCADLRGRWRPACATAHDRIYNVLVSREVKGLNKYEIDIEGHDENCYEVTFRGDRIYYDCGDIWERIPPKPVETT